MRPERTKVSFDCTQNRFSKVKFQTDGWRGGGGGGGVEAGECARSKFTASSPAESRSTEHLSFFVICLYFNIPEQL